MGKFTVRLYICAVHKNLFVSSPNKVSTCRIHGKAVSKKDSVSGIIFVLSSVFSLLSVERGNGHCNQGSE